MVAALSWCQGSRWRWDCLKGFDEVGIAAQRRRVSLE